MATWLGPEDAESRGGSEGLPGGEGEPVAGRGDWGAPHPCSQVPAPLDTPKQEAASASLGGREGIQSQPCGNNSSD